MKTITSFAPVLFLVVFMVMLPGQTALFGEVDIGEKNSTELIVGEPVSNLEFTAQFEYGHFTMAPAQDSVSNEMNIIKTKLSDTRIGEDLFYALIWNKNIEGSESNSFDSNDLYETGNINLKYRNILFAESDWLGTLYVT